MGIVGQAMGRSGIGARLRLQKTMAVRAAGFVLAGAAVCAALFAGSMLRESARALPPPPSGATLQDAKDQSRFARESGRASMAQSEHADDASVGQGNGADALHEWREQEFAFVGIVDGRTLSAGDVTITLDGLELPHPDQVCRTLDDRLEQCSARAATQLELLTRSRRLACRYRMTSSSAGVGSCRIGSRDLAERMIRTGYARAASGRAVMANAGGSDAPAP
jgi:endonuclease YncB( thermonuclease family)